MFYCFDKKIEIIKHRDDCIPSIKSDKYWLMIINNGIEIDSDRMLRSNAVADQEYFQWPNKMGKLKKYGDFLYFAGGNDSEFGLVDIEVWGLN